MTTALCALAAALTLTACATDPLPEPVAVEIPQVETDFHKRLEGTSDLVVAGQHLDAGLLRRFYSRRGFEPVWAARREKADTLLEAVRRARDHGLDPDLFHATLLRNDTTLSPLDRELLLSDSFLSYAEALAHGAVPVKRRPEGEVLVADSVDVPTVLDHAVARSDPAEVIEALAPETPSYRALRQALAKIREGEPADKPVPANRLRTLEVNLERQRWLPRRLPPDRVWVNIADEHLVMYRANRPALSTRVVVGADGEKNQSPEFRATIDASFYNPPWVIPADIATAEILPKLDKDPEYLTRNNMVVRDNGEVEQLPGPDAGLGLVMFDMPNRFDVYLHDTPDRDVFSRGNRRISHGCIRVQHPLELAALLMGQPLEAINEGIATGKTTRNDLPTPVPVFVVYQTAFLDDDGKTLQFRPDFYNRDAAIWQRMQPSSRDAGPDLADTPPARRPAATRVSARQAHQPRSIRPGPKSTHSPYRGIGKASATR